MFMSTTYKLFFLNLKKQQVRHKSFISDHKLIYRLLPLKKFT